MELSPRRLGVQVCHGRDFPAGGALRQRSVCQCARGQGGCATPRLLSSRLQAAPGVETRDRRLLISLVEGIFARTFCGRRSCAGGGDTTELNVVRCAYSNHGDFEVQQRDGKLPSTPTSTQTTRFYEREDLYRVSSAKVRSHPRRTARKWRSIAPLTEPLPRRCTIRTAITEELPPPPLVCFVIVVLLLLFLVRR